MSFPAGKERHRGLTLVEIAVSIGLLLVLIALAIPFLTGYRGRTEVNRNLEVTKAHFERALEEAKSSGAPLPESLTREGLKTASLPPNSSSPLILRLKKRLVPGQEAIVLSERHLEGTPGVTVTWQQIGTIDMESTPELTGVFLEFAEPQGEKSQTLACLPVDVNGEIILYADSANATITFHKDGYIRSLQITRRGTIVLDRR